MEYEEALQLRESDDEFASLDPVKRSYLVFLNVMNPVFSNAYLGVLAHVLYPLFGLVLLFMFAVMKKKFKDTWLPVQVYIAPFLWITFVCQSIRYLFFIHNMSIGTERVPTTREICSLATYLFSALHYLPHFTVAIILTHRVLSLHVRVLTAREMHYALGGMIALFIAMHVIHFNSSSLEMAWICRPYKFNETVLTILHWLVNICIVLNPLGALYLYWAASYHAEADADKEAKKAMKGHVLLFHLPLRTELSMGYWYYVKRYISMDETLHSLYFCIVLSLLFLSFKQFREQVWEWIKFSQRTKLDTTTNIVL